MYSLVFHTNLTPVEYSGKVPSPGQAIEQLYKEAKIGLKKLALHEFITLAMSTICDRQTLSYQDPIKPS
jgi:hypothetical protein